MTLAPQRILPVDSMSLTTEFDNEFDSASRPSDGGLSGPAPGAWWWRLDYNFEYGAKQRFEKFFAVE